jgi:hypothetical protein
MNTHYYSDVSKISTVVYEVYWLMNWTQWEDPRGDWQHQMHGSRPCMPTSFFLSFGVSVL